MGAQGTEAQGAEVIERLYTAFAARDGEAMAACYAEDATFSDPVFPALRGPEVGGMWRMLCEQAHDLEITFSDVTAAGDTGRARWEARYTFSQTRRMVHNRIEARFRMRDGKIAEHTDTFDFYRWSRMALGPPGVILGWTPVLKNKVRDQAGRALRKYLAKAGA